jgi:hypothetical protein
MIDENTRTCLYRAFRTFCLGGDLNAARIAAFRRITRSFGNEPPEALLADFLTDAKAEAQNALGRNTSVDFLHVDVAIGIEPATLEIAYEILWNQAVRLRDPASMACVRLCMIASFGEQRQKHLLTEWKERGPVGVEASREGSENIKARPFRGGQRNGAPPVTLEISRRGLRFCDPQIFRRVCRLTSTV